MSKNQKNQRKYPRVNLDAPADVSVAGGLCSDANIMNISAGGVLIAGKKSIKSTLYVPKNKYTHRPVIGNVHLNLGNGFGGMTLEGVGAHLRRLCADSYQIGFKFLEDPPRPELIEFLSQHEHRYNALLFPQRVRALPC